jgi:hypothetical protein
VFDTHTGADKADFAVAGGEAPGMETADPCFPEPGNPAQQWSALFGHCGDEAYPHRIPITFMSC